ncbi:MAG TPA: superoxide dismutase [Pseudonocardiaceae bacterium]
MSRLFAVLSVLILGVTLVGATPAAATRFPTELALPNGFPPEGITIGDGPTAYFGSRTVGTLFRVDLRTGKGEVFSQGSGTPSLGMKIDARNRLFVAGSTGGDGKVVDARTGTMLAHYTFAATNSFINDVVLTDTAAYFTDSFRPVLYQLQFGRHGTLPATFTTIPLTGDFVQTPGVINANGIARTPDDQALLIVQTNTGKLFRVNPVTGVTRQVDLGSTVLTDGDGILLRHNTLLVVQNRLNTVAVVHLNRSGTAGNVVARLTDPRFDVPTAVAVFGDRLYLPNARFTTPPTPTTPYDAVAIRE